MATERKSNKGAWIVISGGSITVESSEIRALRLAVSGGGTHQYLKYGETFDLATGQVSGSVAAAPHEGQTTVDEQIEAAEATSGTGTAETTEF